MKNINIKNIIKIPYNISIFYCKEKKTIIIKGPASKNFLKLDVEIFISEEKREILVSSQSKSIKHPNDLKKMRGTTTALIKQCMYSTLTNTCLRVLLIGIGYKAFHVENLENNFIQLRLGFSHNLFFKISESLKVICFKLTKLFIYGNSYQNVTQTAQMLRRKKVPEPYKGKGIRYENEKILLKKGKKT